MVSIIEKCRGGIQRTGSCAIERIAPAHAKDFVVQTIADANGKDVFEIESKGARIVLRGNNGVAIASAFHHYLKYSCRCDISWCGDQLEIPAKLPAVGTKVRCVSPHAYLRILQLLHVRLCDAVVGVARMGAGDR